jgi:hypothetical protein
MTIYRLKSIFFNSDEIGIHKRVDNIVKSDFYNYLICKTEIAHNLKLL